MSLWSRLANAAKDLLGISERAETVREVTFYSPPARAFNFDDIIPPIGSLPEPIQSKEPPVEDLVGFIDLLDLRDEYAQNLLDKGWFDTDISADLRHAAREAFFEYTGYEEDEFPWDEWREWYDAA